MTNPKYQMAFPMELTLRGDTVEGFTFRIHDQDTLDPIIPLSVCAQIKTAFGRLLHTYDVHINPVDGTLSFLDVNAIGWPAGVHEFDAEYIFATGERKTHLTGTLPIKEDVSSC